MYKFLECGGDLYLISHAFILQKALLATEVAVPASNCYCSVTDERIKCLFT